MRNGENMSLVIWDEADDPYDHTELAANWDALDEHDHSAGRGVQIPTGGIKDGAITTPKLANNSVTSDKIVDGTIQGTDIADGAITSDKIDVSVFSSITPLGVTVPWFRPSTSVGVPVGWRISDGSTITAADHDWDAGNVTLPDLRGRFVLGAATSGTGVNPNEPPAEKATGGSNSRSYAHTHTVQPHGHTVNAHSHTVDAHSHTVNSHTHSVPNHNHGIYSRLTDTIAQNGEGESHLQTLYVAGFNEGGENAPIPSGGGGTSGTATPGTSNSSPGTSNSSPGTTSVGLTTDSSSPGGDSRPAYYGLLYITKVKYGS